MGVPLRLLCSLAVSLFAACASPPPPSPDGSAPGDPASPAPRHLVLAGGGLSDDNAEVYGRIVALAGGRGAARIGVITAASLPDSQDPRAGTPDASNARDNGAYYARLFQDRYGAAEAVWLPIDLDRVAASADPAVVALTRRMTGFFFGGGDQARLITCLETPDRRDSPVLAALRERYEQGTVVAGSSAGTAIQAGAPMLTGGESYPALRFGAMAMASGDSLAYDPSGGFGLFSYGILDTHFGQRGRQGRVLRLAADLRRDRAFGVDEDTALWVSDAETPAARMTVLGRGGVGIFDLRDARLAGERFGIVGVRVHYLTRGDSYDPLTSRAAVAPWKTALAGRERSPRPLPPSTDIFSSPDNRRDGARARPLEFVKVSLDLFDTPAPSTYGESYETGPTIRVDLRRAVGAAGFVGTDGGIESRSYTDLQVDVQLR